MSELLNAALALAARGGRIFPLLPRDKRPFSGRLHCAHAAHGHGFKDATTDPELINAWWSGHPTAVTNPGGLSASLANSFTYGAGGTTPPPTSTPTVPPSSGTSIGFPLPAKGFGLVVFGGGTNAALVAASTCTSSSLAFWSTNAGGDFDVYVPGASIGAVNEAWNARYANGIPASTPLIGRCQS